MTFAVSLLALALAQQGKASPAAPAAPQSELMVEGKPVGLVFPDPPVSSDSSLLRWKGLGYLAEAAPTFAQRYSVGYDWASLRSPVTYKPDAVNWRIRVVLFASVQATRKGTYGFDQSLRYVFDDDRLEEVKQSLRRLIAWTAVYTDGQVRLVPDVTVEREAISGVDMSPEFATRYFGPRINGGGYEAEDKVFRGPYQSAIYIVPGPGKAEQGSYTPVSVYGTPVVGIAERPIDGSYAPGSIDEQLRQAWKDEVRFRLSSAGYAPLVEDPNPAAPGAWALAADTSSVSTEALVGRLKSKTTVSLGLGRTDIVSLKAPQSRYTQVTLGDGGERGEVLHYVEKGSSRNGGFVLPERSDLKPIADLSKTPTLSFWIRTKSVDTLGLTLIGPDRKVGHVSLGRADLAGLCTPAEFAVAITPDGTWKQITIDAKSIAAKAGFDQVQGLAIEPTPGAILNGRMGFEDIAADFDEFKFTADAPQAFLPEPKADAASTFPEDRARFAAQATASSPELIALLIDPAPIVRLNAAAAFIRLKDAAALPNLLKCIADINPWIDQTALRAFANQGGDTMIATLQKNVRAGATPLARATAGELLGETKDAKYRADIAPLLVDRYWQNRLAAVHALSYLPGNEAAIIRMAFLDQVEPEIKLATTRSVDPKDDYQIRKLLWSAVNEPSDLIRAESDIKLIQSPNESIRSEGYKGVRDDSRTTRILLIGYMTENPNEAHRNALRLAVTDRSPEVRAAALRGFGALEKGAQTDEITNVLNDEDPRVQLALQEFSKKKTFTLPAKTKELMSASPDDRVRQGLAGLP